MITFILFALFVHTHLLSKAFPPEQSSYPAVDPFLEGCERFWRPFARRFYP